MGTPDSTIMPNFHEELEEDIKIPTAPPRWLQMQRSSIEITPTAIFRIISVKHHMHTPLISKTLDRLRES